ncbi:hypothetical protein PQX77_009322, partial [Marasmius sp. AFHP31]
MELNGNDRDSAESRVPNRLREQDAEGVDPAYAVPSVPPEYIEWEASDSAILFDAPEPNAWSVYASAAADVTPHPLDQPAVAQQALQLSQITLDLASSGTAPADFPHRYQRFGDRIDIPYPLPPPDLAVTSLASARDPSPVTSFPENNGGQRMVYSLAIDDLRVSAPAPSYRPFHVLGGPEVLRAPEVVVGSTFGVHSHPNLLQARSFDHAATTN